jgi:hypothetical protein
VPLLAAAIALLVAVPAPRPAATLAGEEARWTTVVAYDEVTVEVDAEHVGGAGPVSAWLRWTFADRAAGPSAWDLGVRYSIDAVEVDCAAAASRTIASTAFAADGSSVAAASYADDGAAWRRHAAASVGGQIAAAVCRLAARP